MNIYSTADLRLAYDHINFLNKFIDHYLDAPGVERAKEMIKETKQAIRKFNHKETNSRLVKDYGSDGFIVLLELPDKDPVGYFRENHYSVCRPSQYDCTGQAFTGWYKIFKRNGKNMCYHRVCFDL